VPHQVATEIWKTTGALVLKGRGFSKRSLFYHAWVTFSATILGFALGTVLGTLLAVGIVHSRVMDMSVMPWIITSQTIPILAIAPMIIVVLNAIGITGIIPKAIISAYLSFFPVVVGMVKGLRAPDAMQLDLMKTYSASSLQVFTKLRWPSSMPYLFASLKVGIAAALIGAIVGELPTGAVAGLGARLLSGSYYGQTVQIWAVAFRGGDPCGEHGGAGWGDPAPDPAAHGDDAMRGILQGSGAPQRLGMAIMLSAAIALGMTQVSVGQPSGPVLVLLAVALALAFVADAAHRATQRPQSDRPWVPVVLLLLICGSLAGAGIGLMQVTRGTGTPAFWCAVIAVWLGAWMVVAQLSDLHLRPGGWAERLRGLLAPLVFGITLLWLWQTGVRGGGVANVILPAPSDIALRFVASAGVLWGDFVQTFVKGALSGYAIGVAAALVFAVLVDRSDFLRRGLLPVGNFVAALPIIGTAPIMVMWFGFGWESKAAVVVAMVVLPDAGQHRAGSHRDRGDAARPDAHLFGKLLAGPVEAAPARRDALHIQRSQDLFDARADRRDRGGILRLADARHGVSHLDRSGTFEPGHGMVRNCRGRRRWIGVLRDTGRTGTGGDLLAPVAAWSVTCRPPGGKPTWR